MRQLNLRLEDAVVRRFEATAAAIGRSNREAAAEALGAWADAHAEEARSVVAPDTTKEAT
jgi:hypothetical protein